MRHCEMCQHRSRRIAAADQICCDLTFWGYISRTAQRSARKAKNAATFCGGAVHVPCSGIGPVAACSHPAATHGVTMPTARQAWAG